jgi:hypothetical protein
LSSAHSQKKLIDASTSELHFDLTADFKWENTPLELQHEKKNMRLAENYVRKIIKKYFNKDIQVHFYNKADHTQAHAEQGGSTIAFNLAVGPGSSFHSFKEMISHGFSLKHFITLIDTVTHELSHTDETLGEETHGEAFVQNNQRKLEQVLKHLTTSEIKALTNEFENFRKVN